MSQGIVHGGGSSSKLVLTVNVIWLNSLFKDKNSKIGPKIKSPTKKF